MTWALSDIKPLVQACWALIEGDDPCPSCGEDPGEGEGLCGDGCPRNALVIALRPFEEMATFAAEADKEAKA